jgi:hypothetical protein
MTGFDHILNWKLKEGSHLFPGKDGGPCINEAAQLRLRTRHPRRMVPGAWVVHELLRLR